ETGTNYKNGNTANESVQVKLSKLVAGKGVEYYYSLENTKQNSQWTKFEPQDNILIQVPGLNKIKIKAVGGFAFNNEIVKTITIQNRIEDVKISPNPIVVEIEKSQPFSVVFTPENVSNKNLDISIEDSSIAVYIGDNTILGKAAGETYLIVKTKDGSNIERKVKVIVKDPYIALKDIEFNKAVYKIEQEELIAL